MIEVPETGDALLDGLAYGTGRLNNGTLANAETAIRRAYDLGIRHFDSSIAYDNAGAHAALGRLLRDPSVDTDSLFVSTKIGYLNPRFPEGYALYRNEDVLWGLVHECNRALGGKIDLLQVHEADFAYWWQPGNDVRHHIRPAELESGALQTQNAPVLRVLDRARSAALVRYVGITGNTAAPLAAVLRSVATTIQIDSVLCAYNLDPIYRGAVEHVVPAARQVGATVLSAGVLQGGCYRTPHDLPSRFTSDARVEKRFAEFGRVQKESGFPTVELLMRWMLSTRDVDRWILGSSGPEQLEQSLEYLRKGPLPSDLQAVLDALAIPDFDRPVDAP